MSKTFAKPLLIAALLVVAVAGQTMAADVWIADILANPARYWNTTVTVTGQVQNAVSNPPGTIRGNYTLLDDSIPTPLVVRTKELPPVGQNFSVTGVIIQDPNQATVPILNELERRSPGMEPWLKALLIGGVALFAVLLVIFVSMLLKPKKHETPEATVYAAPPTPAAAPAPQPTVPAPAADSATRKIPSAGTAAPAATPGGDKTQVFMNLGAELVIEKGPDAGRTTALHKPATTIGRPGARKNDLELSDDTVSKEQAALLYDNNTREFTISNESMTNPTLVNKKVVAEPTLLQDGDKIEMGGTILRFQKT